MNFLLYSIVVENIFQYSQILRGEEINFVHPEKIKVSQSKNPEINLLQVGAFFDVQYLQMNNHKTLLRQKQRVFLRTDLLHS